MKIVTKYLQQATFSDFMNNNDLELEFSEVPNMWQARIAGGEIKRDFFLHSCYGQGPTGVGLDQ